MIEPGACAKIAAGWTYIRTSQQSAAHQEICRLAVGSFFFFFMSHENETNMVVASSAGVHEPDADSADSSQEPIGASPQNTSAVIRCDIPPTGRTRTALSPQRQEFSCIGLFSNGNRVGFGGNSRNARELPRALSALTSAQITNYTSCKPFSASRPPARCAES